MTGQTGLAKAQVGIDPGKLGRMTVVLGSILMLTPLVLNGNQGRLEPGDVLIFADAESAERWMEADDVLSNEYVGIFADGVIADVSAANNVVTVRSTDHTNPDLLMTYLAFAWSRGPAKDEMMPLNPIEICARIGFHR